MDEPWASGPDDDEIVIADLGSEGTPLFHPWPAVRRPGYALAAVALILDTEAEDRTDLLTAIAGLDYAHLRQHLEQHRLPVDQSAERGPLRVVDLCSGVGTMSAAASALGCQVTAIDNAAVPTLMNRLLHAYGADGAVADADPARGWNGLFSELRDAIEEILKSIPTGSGQGFDRIWVRSAACDSCGLQIPMLRDWQVTRGQRLSVEFEADATVPRLLVAPIAVPGVKGAAVTGDGLYTRQGLVCPRCGRLNKTNPAESSVVLPAADIRRPGTHASTVNDHSPRTIVPVHSSSPQTVANPADLWGWTSHNGPLITLDSARTQYQQAYLDRLVEAANQIGRNLEARPSLSHQQRDSVLTGCALLVSAQSTIESTMAAWSTTANRSVIRSPAGQTRPATMFSENGSAMRARLWQTCARLLLDRLRWVRTTLTEPVTVHQGDAGDTGLPDACADAVVWDPPVGDNIDYAAAAFPYEQTLSRIQVQSSDADSTASTNLVPRPGLPEAILAPEPPGRADLLEASADSIRRQAAEARRLLRPDGRVGVYWYAPTSDALQEFLDMVAPSGLQLERAIPVRDPSNAVAVAVQMPQRRTYLLILRSVTESAKATSSVIDAETVLTRVEQDLPVLHEGLVSVLERHYNSEDLEALVPAEYRGTLGQKVTEYVASHPDPGSLLAELGRKALRAELQALQAEVPLDADSRAMSATLLGLLGFSVPRPEGFTVSEALRTASGALVQLALAADLTAVRGQSTTLAVVTERILKFAVVSWAMGAAQTGSSDWKAIVNEVLTITGNKQISASKLSLGDWASLFTLLPKRLAADPAHTSTFGPVHGAIKRLKGAEALSAMVRARNSVAHDKPEITGLTPSALARRIHDDTAGAVRLLDDLHRNHVLPRTMRPVEEIRDVYGRRRLVLTDDQDSRVEVFVQYEHDLTRPLIYLTSGGNPRDVDPTLLDLDEALAALPD